MRLLLCRWRRSSPSCQQVRKVQRPCSARRLQVQLELRLHRWGSTPTPNCHTIAGPRLCRWLALIRTQTCVAPRENAGCGSCMLNSITTGAYSRAQVASPIPPTAASHRAGRRLPNQASASGHPRINSSPCHSLGCVPDLPQENTHRAQCCKTPIDVVSLWQ
jgi:hypothetical protein